MRDFFNDLMCWFALVAFFCHLFYQYAYTTAGILAATGVLCLVCTATWVGASLVMGAVLLHALTAIGKMIRPFDV